MIHTYLHKPASHSTRESRLCAEYSSEMPQSRAEEAVKAKVQMRDNNVVANVRALFDNPKTRRDYPLMEGSYPLNRTFFTALMLSSTLPVLNKSYREMKRIDINVADPLALGGMDNVTLGKWLEKNVQPSVLNEIHAAKKPNKPTEEVEWYEALGRQYLERVKKTKEVWAKRGRVNDAVVTAVPLERYGTMRKEIDAALKKMRINPPGIGVFAPELGENGLTRYEYLTLLALEWKGQDVPKELKKMKDIADLRRYIADHVQTSAAAHKAYVDVSLEEMGPSETLSGLGIHIPVDLRDKYNRALRGEPPATASVMRGAQGKNVLVPDRGMLIRPENAAGVWDTYPDRAYAFLSENMNVPGTRNQEFLNALQYYFVLPDQEKKNHNKPKMSMQNTRATLHCISQVLLESQEVLNKSNDQRLQFRDQLTGVEKLENSMGEMWEYMKDIRSHPIGSAVMWAAAMGTAYMGYKLITGKLFNGKWKTRSQIAGVGALGLLAWGLYDQKNNKKAWWESVGKKVETWNNREKTKKPTEQTLPNYWAEQLEMNSDREHAILAILSEGNVGDVLDWYGKMQTWKNAGKSSGEQPQLPIEYDSRINKVFDGASWDQRGEMFYDVLHKFFANRGLFIRQKYPDYPGSAKVNNTDEAVGYAYMRDRYLEQRYFSRLITGEIKIGNVRIEGRKVINTDPLDPKIIKILQSDPALAADILLVRKQYIEEMSVRRSGDWKMSTVFFLESNPEILRRMGRSGTEAAKYIDEIKEQNANDPAPTEEPPKKANEPAPAKPPRQEKANNPAPIEEPQRKNTNEPAPAKPPRQENANDPAPTKEPSPRKANEPAPTQPPSQENANEPASSKEPLRKNANEPAPANPPPKEKANGPARTIDPQQQNTNEPSSVNPPRQEKVNESTRINNSRDTQAKNPPATNTPRTDTVKKPTTTNNPRNPTK